MTHDEIRELLGAYTLNAVSDEERTVVDEHLLTCQACAAEARDLLGVHGMLGMLVIERDPPPALRERLIKLVELDRREWERERTAPSQAATLSRLGHRRR